MTETAFLLSALPSILLCIAVLPLTLPAWALLVLTLAARRAQPVPHAAEPAPAGARRARVAVLVPAHDESVHILPTLASLRAELGPDDRLLVVADNCSDDTARVARAAGARVVERHDPSRRGKGHALAFGIDALRADPPDVVVVIDADCAVSTGALAVAGQACLASGRPIQLLDLMVAPPGAGLRLRALAFAWRLKNWVRPLGSSRLGGACHLMGTGMALPWHLVEAAPLAHGHIAEDMKLGIDLTRAGHAPMFVSHVRVTSRFATDARVVQVQKARWEHGHLSLIAREVPGLLASAWRRRDVACAVLAMDLLIPPLALYALVAVGASAALQLLAGVWPAAAPAAGLMHLATAGLLASMGLGWWRHGRDLLRLRELLALPVYVAWKLPIYLTYIIGRRSAWVRTRRGPAAGRHGTT
jgi:hypothetical protein